MSEGWNENQSADEAIGSVGNEYLTVLIGAQLFAIPVLQIEDVLGEQDVTKIPLAQPEVAGSLNLRGRIVTAIDVRKRLELEGAEESKSMSVVIEHEGELYSLVVDGVGDVLRFPEEKLEKNPATLASVLKDVSNGIYRLEDQLVVILDVSRLLEAIYIEAA